MHIPSLYYRKDPHSPKPISSTRLHEAFSDYLVKENCFLPSFFIHLFYHLSPIPSIDSLRFTSQSGSKALDSIHYIWTEVLLCTQNGAKNHGHIN